MGWIRTTLAAAGLAGLALGATPAAAATVSHAYHLDGRACDGYPRLPIDTAPGYCAGLVIGPGPVFSARDLRLPRNLLPLPGGRDWIVADLGQWTAGKGSVWRLTAEKGRTARLTRLIGGLSMPHGLGLGPDGKVYVGEMSRIIRFDPAAADPAASVEVVVSGLPDNRLHENRHPLSNFVFDADGSLIVNIGAPTDQCIPQGAARATGPKCLESEGDEPSAVLRRYAYLGDGRWSPQFTVYARGLRNSLALVRHASGTILQGENSYDFDSAAEPYEELNLITAGAHYGWPYCYDLDTPAPGWVGAHAMDCRSSAHTPPALLMPPHAAPLAALYYDGAMFPALKGRLLMTWHGWRPTGSRVVAFRVDAKGVPIPAARPTYPVYSRTGGGPGRAPYRTSAGQTGPAAEVFVLTIGWNAKAGVRPRGAPAGMAVAEDGSIWVADDKNGAIIRIAAEGR